MTEFVIVTLLVCAGLVAASLVVEAAYKWLRGRWRR